MEYRPSYHQHYVDVTFVASFLVEGATFFNFFNFSKSLSFLYNQSENVHLNCKNNNVHIFDCVVNMKNICVGGCSCCCYDWLIKMNCGHFNVTCEWLWFFISSRETFNDCNLVSSLFYGFSEFFVFSEVSTIEISVLHLLNLLDCPHLSDIAKPSFSSSFSSDN